MKTSEILLIGEPSLWTRSQNIRDPRAPEIAELEGRLVAAFEHLRINRPEITGLGAPQLGVPLRMCVVLLPGSDEPALLINPFVAEASLETVDGWECCASIPDLRFGLRRYRKVTVEYVDRGGVGRSLVAEGEVAARLLHEIDHFQGFLPTDRMNDPHLVAHRLVTDPSLSGKAGTAVVISSVRGGSIAQR